MRTARAITAIAAPTLLVASLGVAMPAMAATPDLPASAVTTPASQIDPMTLEGQAQLVAQARQLIPADQRDQAQLIHTEMRPSRSNPGLTDVEIGFAAWTVPVTIFDTVATLTPAGVVYSPMQEAKVPYTPNLDAFEVSDFAVTPAQAAAAAKAYNPNVGTEVMDLRRSNLPHQGLSYAFGRRGTPVVIVSGITGKVIAG